MKRPAVCSLRYFVSLPERLLRAGAAGAGGATHETLRLTLPRFVRRSRLYEATAKNALRITIEFVGGVEAVEPEPGTLGAGRVAVKKTAGNVVELGSIAAFGFSPLWLLAAAADVLHGSRVYLDTLQDELKAVGVLSSGEHFGTIDQLIGALEGATGSAARNIDLPPLELAELRQSIAELRDDAGSLPSHRELAALFGGLKRAAQAEGRSLLETSSGIGLAFLTSARTVTREHLVTPYREEWSPVRSEGFGAYAARVARPYGRAVGTRMDPNAESLTERLPRLSQRALDRVWRWLRRRGSRRGR